MSGQSEPSLLPMTSSKGGRGIHMDTHKGGNGNKIQAMVSSHYFIFCQAALLGVSDHSVKNPNILPVPMNISILKSYGMDSIS